MKRYILFCAAFMLFALSALAQQPDTPQVLVHYKFLYVRDTTNRDKPYKENTGLFIGRNASVYKSYEEHRSTSEYYQFFHEKKMLRKEAIIFSNFLISETLPVINWKISRDTATFGGFHCQKATAHFKGRDYTAWFCPELPLPVGPWELGGLPGVIVEAYDGRKEVCFSFDGIEKLGVSAKKLLSGNVPAVIKVPTNATPTTEKEFNKLQETFRKDPDAFIRMVTGAGDGSGRQMHIDVKPGPGPVINNPIELTEKK